MASFKLDDPSAPVQCDDEKTLTEIEKILELHAFETGDLIHQYYLERLDDQKNMSEPVYGQLTIRAKFTNNELQVGFFFDLKSEFLSNLKILLSSRL